MKNFIKFTVLLLSVVAVGSAQAKSKKKHKAKDNADMEESYSGVPWGMAGCSIWNYVIKDKEQGPQIGVWALEHFVFGVQTFAITSGTSNCVEDSSKMAQDEQKVFVEVNLASLQKEAAQGQGQHLDTLAEIFGCSDKVGFANMSQNRYEAIFTNENPSQVLDSYKSEIKSGTLAGKCTRAS